MSIVLDALNKAEKERRKDNIFSGASESKFIELKKRYKKILFGFIIVNLLIAVSIMLYFMNKQTGEPEEKKAVKIDENITETMDTSVKQPEPRDEENEIANEPAKVEIKKNYMKLPTGREVFISGIMNGGTKDQSIIIEDEILQVGDEYYQVIILEVSKRSIKVKYKEEQYEIPT